MPLSKGSDWRQPPSRAYSFAWIRAAISSVSSVAIRRSSISPLAMSIDYEHELGELCGVAGTFSMGRHGTVFACSGLSLQVALSQQEGISKEGLRW
jgi:hypothetical protein